MPYTPSIIGSGLAGYRFLERTQNAQMDAFARSPEQAQPVAHFKDKIQSVQTVDELMNDRTLLRVALSAFGLEEDIDNPAFIRGVLTSDLNDPSSAANRLSDKRYFALARTFNFGGTTGANLPGATQADAVRSSLESLETPQDLFSRSNFFDRALSAFGLDQFKSQTVLLERVLTSDLDDPNSLAHRLGDARFVEFAQAFQGGESRISAALISKVSDDVAGRLYGLQSSDDLLADQRLLDSVLSVYGLEDEAGNSFMLKQVLDSDVSDPQSFANRLSDPRYAELAEALNFQSLEADKTSVYGFAATFKDKLETLTSSDALLNDPALLQSTLDVFGLKTDDTAFLKTVLDSDLTDPASVANTQEDQRYRAMADAFGFGEMLTGTDRATAQDQLSKMIDAADGRKNPHRDVTAFFNDPVFLLAAFDFFDIPGGEDGTQRAGRVLEAYSSDPTSPGLPRNDTRYAALHAALNLQPESPGRTYPAGFAEAVTERYLDRQFEISVGNIDPDLRIALSFEREFGEAVDSVTSNDAAWFKVIGTPQLRTVFETVFSLPSSFAQLDVDRQLGDLKARAQSLFGTDVLRDLLAPDKVAEFREQYLSRASSVTALSSSPAVSLLAGGGSSASVLNLLL